jgi:signal peptidase I
VAHRWDPLIPPSAPSPEATGRHRKGAGRRRGAHARWRGPLAWLAGTLVVLVAASVAGLLPLQLMRVSSGSMSPTVRTGDVLVVDTLVGPLRRRDVVALEDPSGGSLLVKRVVALGGDTVGIEDGVLVVNGSPVCEPAIDPARIDGEYFGPMTVPDGQLFLLGDERRGSVDSRAFGPVAESAVVGTVGARLWPRPGALPEDRC